MGASRLRPFALVRAGLILYFLLYPYVAAVMKPSSCAEEKQQPLTVTVTPLPAFSGTGSLAKIENAPCVSKG